MTVTLYTGLVISGLLAIPVAQAAAVPATVTPRDLPTIIGRLPGNLLYLADLGQAVAQEISLLIARLGDAQSGKIPSVTDGPGALSTLSNVTSTPKNLIQVASELVGNGLTPANILDLLNGVLDDQINSVNNQNPISPTHSIYPVKDAGDVSYSVDENRLRSAIYIPKTFQYGANGKRPVLLVPGTAVPAGFTYRFGFAKLLAQTAYADPVWVNIPGNSLGDIQITAEYVPMR